MCIIQKEGRRNKEGRRAINLIIHYPVCPLIPSIPAKSINLGTIGRLLQPFKVKIGGNSGKKGGKGGSKGQFEKCLIAPFLLPSLLLPFLSLLHLPLSFLNLPSFLPLSPFCTFLLPSLILSFIPCIVFFILYPIPYVLYVSIPCISGIFLLVWFNTFYIMYTEIYIIFLFSSL